MSHDSNPRPDRLPDALAARVLERAAQLDTINARSVSLADLRTAALGAGISEAALDQALDEMAAGSLTPRPPAGRRPAARRLAPIAALVIAGAAILAAAAALRPTHAWLPHPGANEIVIEIGTPRAPRPPVPPRPPMLHRDRDIIAAPR